MSYTGPIVKELLYAFFKEIKKDSIKEKIMNNLIDPTVSEVFRRYSVYIFFYLLTHIVIIFLLIYLICLIKNSK